MKKITRKKANQIIARAKCASFNVEITAQITNATALSKEEREEVVKKLKDRLSNSVSVLPFAHVYPHEVSFL